MKISSPVSRSGRFAKDPAEDVARFTESISFDWRLWRQDVRGSRAHATMLHKIGLLSRAELNAAFTKWATEWDADKTGLLDEEKIRAGLEDVFISLMERERVE